MYNYNYITDEIPNSAAEDDALEGDGGYAGNDEDVDFPEYQGPRPMPNLTEGFFHEIHQK